MDQMRKIAGGLPKPFTRGDFFRHPVGIPVTFEIDWMIGR